MANIVIDVITSLFVFKWHSYNFMSFSEKYMRDYLKLMLKVKFIKTG